MNVLTKHSSTNRHPRVSPHPHFPQLAELGDLSCNGEPLMALSSPLGLRLTGVGPARSSSARKGLLGGGVLSLLGVSRRSSRRYPGERDRERVGERRRRSKDGLRRRKGGERERRRSSKRQ